MDEQTARSLAKATVQKMLGPVFAAPLVGRRPLNVIDLMYVGAYFTRSMVEFGFDPFDRELYSIFETFPPDPNRVEEIMIEGVTEEMHGSD